MEEKQLQELINTGEGFTLEFKQDLSKTLAKDICAFANSNGGKILLGIDDKGIIRGFSLSNSKKSRVQNLARNMDPSFSVKITQINNITVIDVPEGVKKPYSVQGQFYIRIGANSQQLNRDEIRKFFQKEGQLTFDTQAASKFKFEKDFNSNIYEKFIQRAEITKVIPRKQLLQNLGFIENGELNSAEWLEDRVFNIPNIVRR